MAFEELLVSLASRLDESGFKKLDRLESRAQKSTDILSTKMKQLFVATIGTIGAREIIDATVKLDTLNKSMAALAGSDSGGAEQIEYLRKETQRLGQDFVTTADAYKNLFSAGVGTGMNPEEIQSIFSSVLEAGTVLGSSQQQMQGALMALEQMISKGKVSMEELRRQLGNALPGAMQIAARAMNTTSQGLQEMLEAGLDSKEFVTAFANQLHAEFGEKAVKASHSLRAELVRLQNSLFNLETSFLDGEAGEAFAETIRQLVAVLNSQELQTSLKGISQFLTFLLKNIKPIMAIIAGFGIHILIGRLVKIGVSMARVVYVAFRLFNIAKKFGALKLAARLFGLTNPITAVASAVWLVCDAVAAVTFLFKKLLDIVHKFQKESKDKNKPKWVKTSDGRYTDVNPDSKTYMQFGREFTQEELHNALRFGNKNDFVHKPDRVIKSSPIMYAAPHSNTTTINITTKSDNPQGIGEAVKLAMLDVFESTRIRNGYPKTEAV